MISWHVNNVTNLSTVTNTSKGVSNATLTVPMGYSNITVKCQVTDISSNAFAVVAANVSVQGCEVNTKPVYVCDTTIYIL